jgi:hypothetical protein
MKKLDDISSALEKVAFAKAKPTFFPSSII